MPFFLFISTSTLNLSSGLITKHQTLTILSTPLHVLIQGKAKVVNPTFARFQEVLVAVRNDEKFIYHGDSSSRSRKVK